MKDAKQELSQAQQEAAAAEFKQFKLEANASITANESRIAALKTENKSAARDVRKANEEKIDDLERRNRELKEKLNNYNDDGKSDWREFKTEFNHDLDGIGQAFKDITVRNTK